jgi:hypothetical protein
MYEDLVSGKHEETDLYDAIPRRHTNRSAYNPQKLMQQTNPEGRSLWDLFQGIAKRYRFSKFPQIFWISIRKMLWSSIRGHS